MLPAKVCAGITRQNLFGNPLFVLSDLRPENSNVCRLLWSTVVAVVSCLERNFETSKQSKTPFLVLLSSLTGTSHYFYLDGIWAALHGSEFNPVPCHFVFLE